METGGVALVADGTVLKTKNGMERAEKANDGKKMKIR